MSLKQLAVAAALGVATLLSACGPTDHSRVSVLAEPQPITGTSFAWKPIDPPPANMTVGTAAMVDNPIFRQMAENAISNAMIAKGYKKLPAGEADLWLAYRVGVQQRTRTETTTTQQPMMGSPTMCGRYGCGPAWGWGWGSYGPPQTSTREIAYTEGGLLLDIIDRRTGQLVWRALYKNRVDANSGTQANLDRVAVQLLESLPPAAGSVAAVPAK